MSIITVKIKKEMAITFYIFIIVRILNIKINCKNFSCMLSYLQGECYGIYYCY